VVVKSVTLTMIVAAWLVVGYAVVSLAVAQREARRLERSAAARRAQTIGQMSLAELANVSNGQVLLAMHRAAPAVGQCEEALVERRVLASRWRWVVGCATLVAMLCTMAAR
jgi:hypothetical protein